MPKIRNIAGMTLIEVLIAMAIIAIAMTAIIKATTQNIRGTSYLQNKTMAMWVGQLVLNEARVGLIKFDGDDKITSKTNLLGQDWYWQATEEATPNQLIKKVNINVYAHEIENEETSPLITMETYVYHGVEITAENAAPPPSDNADDATTSKVTETTVDTPPDKMPDSDRPPDEAPGGDDAAS